MKSFSLLKLRSRNQQPVLVSATALFGALGFLLLFPWLSAASFIESDAENINVPAAFSSPCLRDDKAVEITLDVQYRVGCNFRRYGTDRQRELQRFIFQKLADNRKICLNPAQLRQLAELPRIDSPLTRLLTTTVISPIAGQTIPAFGVSRGVSLFELREIIIAAKAANADNFQLPTYFAIRADTRSKSSAIQQLFATLQGSGVNRVNLITQQKN